MRSSIGQTRWLLNFAVLVSCATACGGCVQSSNHPPVISTLQSQRDLVVSSSRCQVTCAAIDPDGDNLTYSWSATGGALSGTGPVTTWVAPDTSGTYTITVKVTDGRGGEATSQLAINMRVNRPPVIESLTAEPPVVNKAETADIKCVAFDPDGDELAYQWVVARGNISGQGPRVTWTAPSACGDYVIRVNVTDGRGGKTSGELGIKVKEAG